MNKQNEVHVMDIHKSVTHIPSFYQDPNEEIRFSKMGDAILKFRQERNITFELCLYGWGNVEKWASKFGDVLWRTSGDIRFEFCHRRIGCPKTGFWVLEVL